jgi:hypothetical protein
VAGAVRARFTDLRRRKTLLDELIQLLERHPIHEPHALESHDKAKEIDHQRAGAA